MLCYSSYVGLLSSYSLTLSRPYTISSEERGPHHGLLWNIHYFSSQKYLKLFDSISNAELVTIQLLIVWFIGFCVLICNAPFGLICMCHEEGNGLTIDNKVGQITGQMIQGMSGNCPDEKNWKTLADK